MQARLVCLQQTLCDVGCRADWNDDVVESGSV